MEDTVILRSTFPELYHSTFNLQPGCVNVPVRAALGSVHGEKVRRKPSARAEVLHTAAGQVVGAELQAAADNEHTHLEVAPDPGRSVGSAMH